MAGTQEVLRSIGLTPTEATIYLGGLEHDGVTAQELGKKTGIKRPTVYHALSTLGEKGLVAENKRGGKTYFRMSSPDHLLEWVKGQKEAFTKREDAVAALVPALSQLQSGKPEDRIDAVQYEGIEGVKAVFDLALYSKSKHWDIIAPVHNFLREYDPAYAAYYLNARKYHGIKSRTLWEPWPDGRKVTPEERRERNPRLMPDSMQGKFTSMMILFDDKVAVISHLKDAFAVVITSKEVHTMLSAMFESLWVVSKEYK